MEPMKQNILVYIKSMVSSWLDNSAYTDEEEIKMLFYSYVITARLLMQITDTTEEQALEIIKKKYTKRFPPLKKTTPMETFNCFNGEMKKWWTVLSSGFWSDDELSDKIIKEFMIGAVVASYMLGYTFNEHFALAESYKTTTKMQKIIEKKKALVRKSAVETKSNVLRKKNYDKIDAEFKTKKGINYQEISQHIIDECNSIIDGLKENSIDTNEALAKIKTCSNYLISKLNKEGK